MNGKTKLTELRVESFETMGAMDDGRGTVHANAASLLTCRLSCPPRYTCPECAPPVRDDRAQEH